MAKRITEKRAQEIVDRLHELIEQSEEGRADYLEDLEKYADVYEGRLTVKTKPWPGCSNVQVPVTQINVEAIFAKMMGAVFNNEPFWNVRPMMNHPEIYEGSKSVERFLQYASTHILDMYNVCSDWFLYCIKYGTSMLYTYWSDEKEWRYKRYNDVVEKLERQKYLGPKMRHIPMHEFHHPQNISTLNRMPWCGHTEYLTYPELLRAKQDENWINVDYIKGHPDRDPHAVDEVRAEEAGFDPKYLFDVWKIRRMWALVDIEDNGEMIPCTIIYHPNSRKVLYLDYFEYDHCRRPYVGLRYMPRDGYFAGIGVIQMLRYIQDSVDTAINLNFDNAAIANMRYYVANRNNVEKDIKMSPGKIVYCDDPKNDFIGAQVGQEYPGLFSIAQNMSDWGDKRTGVTEYNLGRESSVIGSRATATSTLALIQESNRRFDLTLRDIRSQSTELGYQALELWQQFTVGPFPYTYRQSDVYAAMDAAANEGNFRNKVQGMWDKFRGRQPEPQNGNKPDVINFADYDYRQQMLIELSANRASLNREVEKQNYLALFQMMMGYYRQTLELSAQMGQEQMAGSLQKVAKASEELASRVLESFDVRDATALIPAIGEMNGRLSNIIGQFSGGPNNMGGNPHQAGEQIGISTERLGEQAGEDVRGVRAKLEQAESPQGSLQ